MARFMIKKNVLKRSFFIVLCFLMVLSIVGCISTEFLYKNMLYDSVEYNGTIYCRLPDSDRPEKYETTDFNLPVFIVDNENKTRKDHVYYAAAITDDSEHVYLIFDGGTFLRSDLFPSEN